MVREQLENQMARVLIEIRRREEQINAAEVAKRDLEELRLELARLAGLYAGVKGMEATEKHLGLNEK